MAYPAHIAHNLLILRGYNAYLDIGLYDLMPKQLKSGDLKSAYLYNILLILLRYYSELLAGMSHFSVIPFCNANRITPIRPDSMADSLTNAGGSRIRIAAPLNVGI